MLATYSRPHAHGIVGNQHEHARSETLFVPQDAAATRSLYQQLQGRQGTVGARSGLEGPRSSDGPNHAVLLPLITTVFLCTSSSRD